MNRWDEMSAKLNIAVRSLRNLKRKRSLDTKVVDNRVKKEYPCLLRGIAPSPW
jgi:uncharacterized protein YlxP (DUF503 family)